LISSICSILFYEFGYNILQCLPAQAVFLSFSFFFLPNFNSTYLYAIHHYNESVYKYVFPNRHWDSWGQELCFISLCVLKGNIWRRPNQNEIEWFCFNLWHLKYSNYYSPE
jgi:hypothetical protein